VQRIKILFSDFQLLPKASKKVANKTTLRIRKKIKREIVLWVFCGF